MNRALKLSARVILLCASLWGFGALAADTPYEFKTAGEQARYQTLLAELRCLVCQNQSLADSHADLAQDLRDEVFRMISEGASNDAILDFMVSRYGDFVLYKPPVKTSTVLLWFGPIIFIVTAAFIIRHQVKKVATSPDVLTAEQSEFAAHLQKPAPPVKESNPPA